MRGQRALHRNGIKISNGTIVDATIIGAPSSTKNKEGKRDPEIHQVAKGKQWYFGMKAHVTVDGTTKTDPHASGIGRERIGRGCATLSTARSRDACVG